MTNLSVSAPSVARAGAAYPYRVLAALLDCLVFYTMIFVISIVWLKIARIPAAPAVEAQSSFLVICAGSIGLYLLIAGVLGRTLGMQALGLRIVCSETDTAPDFLRALGRTLALLVAIGLIFTVHPALFVVYSLWMMLNPRRQMLHDQVAGTAVIRTAVPNETQVTVGAADPSLASLEPPQAKALLDDLDLMRRRAHGDLHAASVPLLVLGLLAVGGAMVGWDSFGELFWLSWPFWTLAGPVGLLVTAWWFRRLQRDQGAGTGVGPLVVITIFVACASFTFSMIPVGGVITALGFLAFALSQNNRVLAVAAVIFGLVTGLEQPLRMISFSITNTFPDLAATNLLTEHGNAIIFGVLASFLLLAGVTYLRRERLSAPDHPSPTSAPITDE